MPKRVPKVQSEKLVSAKKAEAFIRSVQEAMADLDRTDDRRDLCEWISDFMDLNGIPSILSTMDIPSGNVTYVGPYVKIKKCRSIAN